MIVAPLGLNLLIDIIFNAMNKRIETSLQGFNLAALINIIFFRKGQTPVIVDYRPFGAEAMLLFFSGHKSQYPK